jgi:hypothetical protein
VARRTAVPNGARLAGRSCRVHAAHLLGAARKVELSALLSDRARLLRRGILSLSDVLRGGSVSVAVALFWLGALAVAVGHVAGARGDDRLAGAAALDLVATICLGVDRWSPSVRARLLTRLADFAPVGNHLPPDAMRAFRVAGIVVRHGGDRRHGRLRPDAPTAV